jgi:hypothetical protein
LSWKGKGAGRGERAADKRTTVAEIREEENKRREECLYFLNSNADLEVQFKERRRRKKRRRKGCLASNR